MDAMKGLMRNPFVRGLLLAAAVIVPSTLAVRSHMAQTNGDPVLDRAVNSVEATREASLALDRAFRSLATGETRYSGCWEFRSVSGTEKVARNRCRMMPTFQTQGKTDR